MFLLRYSHWRQGTINALEKLISDPDIYISDSSGHPMFKEDKLRLEQVLAQPQIYWAMRYKKRLQFFLFNQQNEGWEAERLGGTMTRGEGEGEAKEPW